MRYAFLSALFAVLMAACVQASRPDPLLTDDVLFIYQGHKVKVSDLPAEKQTEIYRIELKRFESLRKIAQAEVQKLYGADEAKRRGVAPEVIKAELAEPKPVTDDDLRAFYGRDRGLMKLGYESVKEELRAYLEESRAETQQTEALQKIAAERNVVFAMTKPEPPAFKINAAEHPSIATTGQKGETVEVVQVLNYLCPHCRQAEGDVQATLKDLGRPVRLVTVDMPASDDPASMLLAKGAYCSWKAGKYAEYRSLALEFNGQAFEVYGEFPEKLKMPADAWQTCLDSAPAEEYVTRSIAEAKRLGATGTPTFFVNGRRLDKIATVEAVKDVLR